MIVAGEIEELGAGMIMGGSLDILWKKGLRECFTYFCWEVGNQTLTKGLEHLGMALPSKQKCRFIFTAAGGTRRLSFSFTHILVDIDQSQIALFISTGDTIRANY